MDDLVRELVEQLGGLLFDQFPITLAILLLLVLSLLYGIYEVWRGARKEGQDPRQLLFIRLAALALAVIAPLTAGVYLHNRSRCENLYKDAKASRPVAVPPTTYGNGTSRLSGVRETNPEAKEKYNKAKCSWVLGRRA